MGIWGPAIFSDDTASDIRDLFYDYAGDGLSRQEIRQKLLEEFSPSEGDENSIVFWLALAAMQSKTGRLEDEIKAKALAIIESGEDLDRWDDNKFKQARAKVLVNLKAELEGTPKNETKIAKRFKSNFVWKEGEVIAFNFHKDWNVLIRVDHLRKDRGGSWPVVEILDWVGKELPSLKAISKFKVRYRINRFKYSSHSFNLFGFTPKRYPADKIIELKIIIKRRLGFKRRIKSYFYSGWYGKWLHNKLMDQGEMVGTPCYQWHELEELLCKEFGLNC